MFEWIDINEKLPPADVCVLVCGVEGYFVAMMDESGSFAVQDTEEGYCFHVNVKYWTEITQKDDIPLTFRW